MALTDRSSLCSEFFVLHLFPLFSFEVPRKAWRPTCESFDLNPNYTADVSATDGCSRLVGCRLRHEGERERERASSVYLIISTADVH